MFDVRWSSHRRDTALNDAMCGFVGEIVWGEARPFPLATTMGVFEENVLIAAMVFHNYDKAAGVVEVSGAATTPRWITRSILWEMFDFPFNELNCQAVVMRVDSADKRLGRILPSYGFVKYEIPRLRGRDKSEMIYILHDDVWCKNGFHK